MIQNQWYAVLSSKSIKKGQVVGARRFGENLIFFRTEDGEIGCVTSLCAHRGASLAKGWVENDHIKCPFHGIQYDKTGKCVYVPSDGRSSAQNYLSFHLKHYPVKEIGDIVFAWYGDKEPDNETDSGQTPKSADESLIKSTNLTFKFPNMWLNHVTDKIQILAFFIPVDDENAIIALRFYNKITGIRCIDMLIARLGSKANIIIERQDKRIVETQLPKKSELRMSENLVAADFPIIEYRGKRDELMRKFVQLNP